MADPTDALSDKALAASKLAHLTHSEDHHRAAGAAHTQAFQAAQQNRPALASHHLQQAATHDRHLDASTPEGKASAAFRASAKAKESGAPADHDAAAEAHREAADAYQEAGRHGESNKHGTAGYRHQEQAQTIRARAAAKQSPGAPPNPVG